MGIRVAEQRFLMFAGSQTHLAHPSFVLRNRISLSGLHSDRLKMGLQWAAPPSLVSCIIIQMICLGLKTGWSSLLGGAKIRFNPIDLDVLKVPWPDAADRDTYGLA